MGFLLYLAQATLREAMYLKWEQDVQVQGIRNSFLVHLLTVENRTQQVEVEEMKNKILKG